MSLRRILKSKLHNATVTHADVNYEGSITLSPELMQAADLSEYEAVWIWDTTNGARLETYVIQGLPGSRDIAINGAAAHLIHPGDRVIIACFQFMTNEELINFQPKLVFLDRHNNIKEQRREVPGPQTTLINC